MTDTVGEIALVHHTMLKCCTEYSLAILEYNAKSQILRSLTQTQGKSNLPR